VNVRARAIGRNALATMIIFLGSVAAPMRAQAQTPNSDTAPPSQLSGKASMNERWPIWRCDVHSRVICAGGVCETVAVAPSWILFDFAAATYSRCDPKGCDAYQFVAIADNMFTSLYVPGRPVMFKAINDGSHFTEVALLGLSIFNSFGVCRSATE
jgi:invasion protein IalB